MSTSEHLAGTMDQAMTDGEVRCRSNFVPCLVSEWLILGNAFVIGRFADDKLRSLRSNFGEIDGRDSTFSPIVCY